HTGSQQQNELTLPVSLSQAEVEETLKRIQGQKGVQGIIIVNSEGIPVKTTLDNSSTVQYAGLIHQLVMKARSTVRDIDPQNDLTFLRIRSKKNEIMIAPGIHPSILPSIHAERVSYKDYFLIVIQNPSD
ncbi:dynein light chain roadblock-type 1, partial [Pleuronectes platessa]|uniref:dynein light chain roadblock-type 1 n=1 Tax=Pleuronectes platessa TaxID=8262 RepID=UPI00232A0BDB